MADILARIVLAAKNETSAAFRSLKADLQGAQDRLTAFRGALAAVGVVGVGALFRGVVNGIDKLNDLSDATGASVESLSALEDVAIRSGNSFESVSTALVKLNQALSAAKPDSDQARAIEAIGLSVADLKKADPVEALRLVAVALSGFENTASKSRITQELFGKSLREVAPLLKDMAEAGALVATQTTKQAEEAEKFNKELAQLAKNSTDTARALVGALLPAMNQVLAARRTGEAGKTLLDVLGLDKAEERLSYVANGYRLLGLARERLNYADRAAKNPNDQVALAELARIDAKARELADSFNKSRNIVLGLGDSKAGGGRGFVNPNAVTPARPVLADLGDKPKAAAAEKVNTEAERYLETLRKQLETTQELSAYERALGEIRTGRLEFSDKVSSAAILGLAAEIDATKEATRVARERADFRKADNDAAEQASRDNEQAARDRLRNILAQTDAGKLRAVVVDIDLLNAAFADGRLDADEYAQGVRAVTSALNGGKDSIDAMSEFAAQAARNIQDTLGNSLEAALAGNFSSIEDLWVSTLRKMAAQALALKLNQYLFGDLFGKDGTLGGLAKTGVDFVSSLLGGARADGGPVSAGVPYLVGERGPEIVVPRNAGTVLPNGMGLGMTVVQNFSVGGQPDQRTLQQIGAAAARGLATASARNN